MTAIEDTLDALQQLLGEAGPLQMIGGDMKRFERRVDQQMAARERLSKLSPSVLQAALVLAKAAEHSVALTWRVEDREPLETALTAFVRAVSEGMRTE